MRAKALGLVAALLIHSPLVAQQAPTSNIRGAIETVGAESIVVRTRDGATRTITLPADVAIAVTKPFTLSDIKPGMTLGVTTAPRADGQIVALDVRPIPATARVGLSPYDLREGSTMTNAVLAADVARSDGRELTLDYKSGVVKVLVTPETTMSQSAPGSREDLKPGETAYVAARDAGDGRLVAVRVQVSKDGVKPTQ
ncbi:MAG TPA: hypothetical protein VIL72_08915 [Beijerinckiaceae bacterium]|jgi:hypothetical protein